ncbi:MAG: caspase family protein [Haliscomenobacteraceae bacterium CHB4]|nr:hypothetical protein [Saprospiraceae bacterium]MCE7924547.1 caspase family protein [Haliscomenobacteraceae bacterium CHB4]
MRKILFIIILLGFLLPIGILRAQVVQVEWDSLYAGKYSESIHSVIRLKDGRLAAVGEAYVRGQGSQGLFMLFDPFTGKRLAPPKLFGGFLEDVFLDVAEAKDGNIYLVGETNFTKKQAGKGWLVRLDENGEELSNVPFDKYGVTRIEKIVWTKSGKGLLAAKSGSPDYEGSLLVFPVEGKRIETPVAVGEGVVQDLVAMVRDMKRGVWLCGNARKSDIGREGDIWAVQLDDKGGRLGCCAPVKGHDFKQLHGASSTYDGGLLLAGEIWKTSAGDNDVWMMEIGAGDIGKDTVVFGNVGVEEYASVPVATPGGRKWLIVHRKSGASVQVYDGDLGKKSVFPLPKESNFRVARLFQLRPNLYVLAGTSYDPLRKGDAVRLICLRDDEVLPGKGKPAMAYGDVGFSETDGDGDNRLGAGEHGYVSFLLKNTGNAPITSGIVNVTVENPVNGLVLKHNRQEFNYIAALGSESISIGVRGDKNIAAGVATLRIRVEVSGLAPLDFTAPVPCGKVAGSKTTVIYNKPNANRQGNSKSNEYETGDPNFPVELRVISPNGDLKTLDGKTLRNGAVVRDLPKNRQELSAPSREVDLFVYTYTCMVPLEDGRNVIYFEFDDGRSDSIVVLFNKEKRPNLHLLTIGVPDSVLRFPSKDAQDFARLMQEQAGNGLFERIYVDALYTPEKTTRDAIEGAFNDLVNRYLFEQKIKSYDYLVIFISSHGMRRDDGRFCLLPTGYDANRKIATTVDYRDLIEKYLNLIRCKKILFLDACQSGSAKTPPDPYLSEAVQLANSVAEATVTFTSCSPNELSYELPKEENGAFTEGIIEAFGGSPVEMPEGQLLKADTKSYDKFGAPKDGPDGLISLEELEDFLAERVPYVVKSKQGYSQHPVVNGIQSVEYLPIFKLK